MQKLQVTCLLLCSLSVLVKGETAGGATPEFKVEPSSGGAKVTCPTGYKLYKGDEEYNNNTMSMIKYKDSNSGEYQCKSETGNDILGQVFIKYRSCDNCVELDVGSIAGMIVGDVVATFVIGVSVYLLAKHSPSVRATPNKKGSDRYPLVPNEVGNDEHYQRLQPRNRDVYDKLRK